MKCLLIALALFSLCANPALAQFGHRSNPAWGGVGDVVKTAAAITTAGSGNCPGTGCVAVATWGSTTGIATITGTWSATLEAACTPDNWATVVPISVYILTAGVVSGTGQATFAANGNYLFPTLGYPQCGVYATAYTSGTVSVRVDADPSSFFSASQVASPGHRTFVVLGADGVTPAVSETLITFSKNVGGTVTGSQTSYAITANKTLHVNSVCASVTAGAAANRVRVAVRLNTGGACVAGSGLLLPAIELAPNYGTATAAEGGANGCVTIPDGLELAGTSWNVCLTESATAASGTLTASLIGYEY